MPLPLTVSCSSKIQIGFTFLVPAYPGYPGKEAVKWLLLLLYDTIRSVQSNHIIYLQQKATGDSDNVEAALALITETDFLSQINQLSCRPE